MIEFHLHSTDYSFDEKKATRILVSLVDMEGFSLKEVSVVLCDDDYLLGLNKGFLDHDYYTDILTFDYSENKEIRGELFISYDRVLENSISYNVTINQELTRVLVHGFLHLCGYKDSTVDEKSVMTSKEDFYLACFGVL
jgi:rRNA maturation RNase YbeY